MNLRPYIHENDYVYLEKWVKDERDHALWCANFIPYPMTKESLRDFLEVDAKEWGSRAYTVTGDKGTPIGFFTYSLNQSENSGFLKFVILDYELRGKGYGTQMMKLVLTHAFEITGVSSIQLNVFDVNTSARKCYLKAGFKEDNVVQATFPYKEERWGRCHMVILK